MMKLETLMVFVMVGILPTTRSRRQLPPEPLVPRLLCE